MSMRVRARVLIPVALFVAVAIPALLIPTGAGHDTGPALPSQTSVSETDPLKWETGSTPSDSEGRVTPEEVSQCLECYLGD